MPATDTERLAVLIEANTRSYERAMARIEGRTNQAIGRATRSVKSLDSQMKATALTAARFMGVFGVTLGIGGISQLISQMDELGKQAKRTGVDVESLQALLRSAKLSGAAEGSLERGFQILNEQIGKAMAGTTDFGRLMDANNVKLRDANGEVRSTKEIFLEVADLVANAGNHIDRARIAQLAMTRSGRELLPLLMQGADALRDQEQAARESGKIIDAELIAKAEKFRDAWADVWTGFRAGALNAIGIASSALSDFIDSMNKMFPLLDRLDDWALRGGALGVPGGGKPLEITVAQPRGPATVVPGERGKGGKAPKTEIDREREALERLLESHRLELAVLRELDPIQKEMIGHRETLSVATEDERQELENLIRTMRDLEEAQMLAAERMQAFQQAAFGALDGLIIRGQKATDVMRDLLTQIARMALHSAIFGGGLFGGGGLGSLFPAAKALGGPVTAGRPYMVGERGPELFIPKASGQIVANDNIGGVTVAPVYQIDARGSDISESRFRAILEQNNQQLRSQVVPMIREAQSRRVL